MVNLDLKRNANKNFTEKPFFTYQINKRLMGTQHTLWIDLGKTGTLIHTSRHANGTTVNGGKLVTSCKITQAFNPLLIDSASRNFFPKYINNNMK